MKAATLSFSYMPILEDDLAHVFSLETCDAIAYSGTGLGMFHICTLLPPLTQFLTAILDQQNHQQ